MRPVFATKIDVACEAGGGCPSLWSGIPFVDRELCSHKSGEFPRKLVKHGIATSAVSSANGSIKAPTWTVGMWLSADMALRMLVLSNSVVLGRFGYATFNPSFGRLLGGQSDGQRCGQDAILESDG